MFKNILALVVIAIFTTDHLHAQESKHQVRFTVSLAPPFLAKHSTHIPDDSGFEYYENTGFGIGVGYSRNLSSFISFKTGLDYLYLNGTEGDGNAEEFNNRFQLLYLSLGPSFHIIRGNPEFDIDLGFLLNGGSINPKNKIEDKKDFGTGYGVYFGLGVTVNQSKKRAVRIGVKALGFITHFVPPGRNERFIRNNIAGLSTVFNVSYILKL